MKRGGTNCEPFKGNNGIDYVIASDCIYLEAAFIPLINTLLDLSNEQTTIIISYQKRRKADKRFWNVAKKKFQIQQVFLLYNLTRFRFQRNCTQQTNLNRFKYFI